MRLIAPVIFGVIGVAFAVMAISLSFGTHRFGWWVLYPADVVGLLFLGSGVVMWIRRPDTARMGLLVAVLGIAWFCPYLQFSKDRGAVFYLGFLLFFASIPVWVQVLFAAPRGRLRRPAEIWLVIAIWATILVTQGMRILTERPLLPQIWGDPTAPISIWAQIGDVLGIILFIPGFALVVRRWQSTPAPARRAWRPIWAVATILGALLVAIFVVAGLGRAPVPVTSALLLCYFVATPAIGIAVGIGIVRTSLATGHKVARLLEALRGGKIADSRLRDALAVALEDPSLTLHLWSADTAEYVDFRGRPAPLPAGGSRAVTRIAGSDHLPVAALAHDAYLVTQPQHRRRLDLVVAAAGLALENTRLDAERRAHSLSLVQVEGATRNKIQSVLHDSVQHRLSSIQLQLGQLRKGDHDDTVRAQLTAIDKEAQAVVQDLREVIAGIFPSDLRRNGLRGAVDGLAQWSQVPLIARVSPRRWDAPAEEAAFFLISEAVGNSNRHAHATQITVIAELDADGNLRIRVTDDGSGGAVVRGRGTGLRGMHDRIAAHSGTLTIDSTSSGTTIEAVIPCA